MIHSSIGDALLNRNNCDLINLKQFGEVGLWSRPLTFPEIQNQFLLNPREVMRVYKRYLTR